MKKGEIAKAILKILAASAVLVAVAALPGAAPILKMFDTKEKFVSKEDRERIQRTLRALKKNRFINTSYVDGKEVIELTDMGRRKLVRYEFNDMKINIPKKWDGLWRVIIFDIPEEKKPLRNAFHMKLRELGFEPIQKSTFVLPYNCKDIIEFLGDYFHIRENIKYILAKEIEGAGDLKRKFKI